MRAAYLHCGLFLLCCCEDMAELSSSESEDDYSSEEIEVQRSSTRKRNTATAFSPVKADGHKKRANFYTCKYQ